MIKKIHPSLLEGDTPVPMDIGKISTGDKSKNKQVVKTNDDKSGKGKTTYGNKGRGRQNNQNNYKGKPKGSSQNFSYKGNPKGSYH